MKIRNGFVSNSSSSSFILPLDKKVESKEELLKALNLNLINFAEEYQKEKNDNRWKDENEITFVQAEDFINSAFNVLWREINNQTPTLSLKENVLSERYYPYANEDYDQDYYIDGTIVRNIPEEIIDKNKKLSKLLAQLKEYEDEYGEQPYISQGLVLRDIPPFVQEEWKRIYFAANAIYEEISQGVIRDLKENKNNSVFYHFHFSDNDGEIFSFLEHVTLFQNVMYLYENHH